MTHEIAISVSIKEASLEYSHARPLTSGPRLLSRCKDRAEELQQRPRGPTASNTHSLHRKFAHSHSSVLTNHSLL